MLPEVVKNIKIDRLTRDYQVQSQQWNNYKDILDRLRSGLPGMPEGLAKINLENEISEQERKFKEVEKVLEQIEEELNSLCQIHKGNGQESHSLQEAQDSAHSAKDGLALFLLYLDFVDHVKIFQKFQDKNKCRFGSFLIHGSVNYGHIWLLKRLLEAVPDHQIIPPIECDVRSSLFVSDVEKLWRTLASKVGISHRSSQQDIAQGVAKRLQNQHIIFVVHGVEYMGEAYLQELIRKFWCPLVNLVQASQLFNKQFQLLLFLIDYTGESSQWDIKFADQVDDSWRPSLPIKLPKLQTLSEEALNQLQQPFAASVLPRSVFECPDLIQMLLAKTQNGIPGLLLKEIYEACNYDWYEEEEKWLKL